MFFSFIIPVYNRPDEVDELLGSLVCQTCTGFEVIVVEDGSTIPCKDIVHKYSDKLSVKYYSKPNTGPAKSRNFGATLSSADYLIFLDSDCILPKNYLETVACELMREDADAFGGADKADSSFTRIQKAINYSMTSFLTTGGIRGGKKKLDKFYPRSFNLGIKKSLFLNLGGFSNMRFGEDIDLSIRIYDAGYNCRLFSESWVYHKRRTDFKKFFKQIYNSGIARITLLNKYPGSLKAVHCLPSLFLISLFVTTISMFFSLMVLIPILSFILLVFVDATIKNKSITIGFLAVVATFVQLISYGGGFIIAWWKLKVLKHRKFIAFEKNFYQ